MTKFRVIKIKQNLEELKQISQKTQDSVRNIQNALQSLASLGSAFGINTNFLTTVSGMAGNIVSFWNAISKSPKSKGLNKNDLLLAEILKKDKNFEKSAGIYIRTLFTSTPPTSMPEEGEETSTGRTPEEEAKLMADLIADFKKQKVADAMAQSEAKRILAANPNAKTINDIHEVI
ncbi:MAG: hypothetical protein WC495_06520 [Patescibacteria group bacterium]|jgi:hypothetical protein